MRRLLADRLVAATAAIVIVMAALFRAFARRRLGDRAERL